MAGVEGVWAGRRSADRGGAVPFEALDFMRMGIDRAIGRLSMGGANTDKCPGIFYILKLTNCY